VKFSHLNRRIHLYLALFLLPWFLLYGVSSIPFSHGTYFEELDRARKIPLWNTIAEKSNYDMPPHQGDDLKAFAARIVKDNGLSQSASYGAYRQSATQINVYVYSFWKSTQVKCFLDEKRLLIEDRRFRWDHFLTGIHAKGGFEMGGFHTLWALFVDLVCFGMLLWVITGLIMWWNLPPTRNWGWLALATGVLSFGLLVWLC
jgi:hypothetical protein